jgi:asparagine synthase (glutamine-hydrolysing)
VNHFEYPLSYEASVGLAALAKRARDDDVKVLLSGEGADELLGGYPWLHEVESADFFARQRLSSRMKRRAARWKRTAPFLGAERSRGPVLDRRADGLCADSLQHDARVLASCRSAYRHHDGARHALEARLLSDFRVSLPQILARGDKNTMQHSIETRVPFLDPGLVELCVNLPLEHRIEPLRKNPLAVLAERHLPAGLSTRPKIGFNFDVSAYLGSRANPAFLADGMLRDLFRVPGADWRANVSTDPFRGTMLLWSAEIWARLFLEGSSPAAVERDLFRADATAGAPAVAG